MWSLERVGMVYGLQTIGKVDWYDWGSKSLLAAQQANGSWNSDGFHSGSSENATAFALLFLSRANLAEDLTTSMKNKIKDPGTFALRSPGDLNKMLEAAGKSGSGSKVAKPAKSDMATKLVAAMSGNDSTHRSDLLAKYRESKGGEYTDALARAAAKLSGEAQAQVRAALRSA